MSGTKVPRDPNLSQEMRRFLDDISRAAGSNMDEETIKGRAVGAGTGPGQSLTPAQAWAVVMEATTLPVPSSKMTFEGTTGDEGGQFQIEKAANSNLAANVSVDQFVDKIRIFEGGGSARGYYLDISHGAAGAASPIAKKERASAGSVGTGASHTISSITKHDIALLQLADLSHNSGGTANITIELSANNGSSWSTAQTITATAIGAGVNATYSVMITHDGSYNYRVTIGSITTTGANSAAHALGAQMDAIRIAVTAGVFDAGVAFLHIL